MDKIVQNPRFKKFLKNRNQDLAFKKLTDCRRNQFLELVNFLLDFGPADHRGDGAHRVGPGRDDRRGVGQVIRRWPPGEGHPPADLVKKRHPGGGAGVGLGAC